MNITALDTNFCYEEVVFQNDLFVELLKSVQLGNIITHLMLILMALKLYSIDNKDTVVNVTITVQQTEEDDDTITESDSETEPTPCELDDIPCECPGGGRYNFRKTAKRKFCDKHA